jgi:SAM-dependent methyltransferase
MDTQLYDELYRVEHDHWWFQARRHIVWSLVRRHLDGVAGATPQGNSLGRCPSHPRRLRICELGCGTGGNLAAIADQHDVIGVECSPHALEYARRRLGNRVIAGSLPNEVQLPANTFDVVLLTDVLEHIEDDAASAQTALRLVRPGGIVVATVPAYQWLYSPRDAHHHHFRRYSKRHFRDLWRTSDAQIELLSHYNTLLFPPAAVVRLASKVVRNASKCGDLTIPYVGLNRALSLLMRCEAHFLGRLPMPFGLSLVAVVRQLETTSTVGRCVAA